MIMKFTTEKMDKILQVKHLQDIIKNPNSKQMAVFVIGVTGCSKHTLSVFQSHQWREKLLSRFELAPVQFQSPDPVFQSAKCIINFLSSFGANAAQQIANKSPAKKSQGVLLLDQWNELPSNTWSVSISHMSIQPELLCKNLIYENAVNVTIMSDGLHSVVSSHTHAKMFDLTFKEYDVYFTDCLSCNTNVMVTLSERIQVNVADLLPHSNGLSSQVFQKISDNHGKSVLFILDGWDELPSNLHKDSSNHELMWPELSCKKPLHPDEFMVCLKSPCTNLTPSQTSTKTWPPVYTHMFFHCSMIRNKVRKIDEECFQTTITGKVGDILNNKEPIKEVELDRPQVVLIEGAPGSGKSTLSVFVSQQWEQDQLFVQYKSVIFIQWQDPIIQSVICHVDVVPNAKDMDTQWVMVVIVANTCQGVPFLQGECGKLSYNPCKDLIFYQLILPECSKNNEFLEIDVFVTSQPIASDAFYTVISSGIDLLGFSLKEINGYMTDCLKGGAKAQTKENPAVENNCYLPLYVSIILHLFKTNTKAVPATQLYCIFSEPLSYILCCLNSCTHHKLGSLDQPSQFKVVDKPFNSLHEVMYSGVKNDKVSFSAQLQASEQLYNNMLFNASHFSAVFQFYATTVLQTSNDNNVFTEYQDENLLLVVSSLFPLSRIFKSSSRITPTQIDCPCICTVCDQDCRYNGSSLLKCPSDHCKAIKKLCLSHVKGSIYEQKLRNNYRFKITNNTVPDKRAFYIAGVMKSVTVCDLNLQYCVLTSKDVEYLCDPLTANNSPNQLEPTSNALCDESIQHVAYALRDNHSFKHLGFAGSMITNFGLNKHLDTNSIVTTSLSISSMFQEKRASDFIQICHYVSALDYSEISKVLTVEQQKSNNKPQTLGVETCDFGSNGIKSLSHFTSTNTLLKTILFKYNPLYDDDIQQLSHALRVSNFGVLDLQSCTVTSLEVEVPNILLKQLGNVGVITENRHSVVNQWPMNKMPHLKDVLPAEFTAVIYETTSREGSDGLPLIRSTDESLMFKQFEPLIHCYVVIGMLMVPILTCSWWMSHSACHRHTLALIVTECCRGSKDDFLHGFLDEYEPLICFSYNFFIGNILSEICDALSIRLVCRLLLLLSGDIEENPGPIGMYRMIKS